MSHWSNYPVSIFALVPSVTSTLVLFIENSFGDPAALWTPMIQNCRLDSTLLPVLCLGITPQVGTAPHKPGHSEKESDSTSISWQGEICIPNCRPS